MPRAAKLEPFSRCRSATASRPSSGQYSAPAQSATSDTPATLIARSCGGWIPGVRRAVASSGAIAHCLPHQILLGFGQERVGCFAVDHLAADLEHDRNREWRHPVELLMNDSPLHAREHLSEPANIEQSRCGICARGAQEYVVCLMLAQHVVDKVCGNRHLAARFLLP